MNVDTIAAPKTAASSGYSAVRGMRVLITGGTGSFGHWVARGIAQLPVKSIVIFSRDENKQEEMRRQHPDYEYIIGDVRDYDRLADALAGVDIVFHAAALKQVPSCEIAPTEAIQTNVLGTDNLCRAALRAGVQRVVAMSTDKAVKPISVMGLSKAMAEKIVCSQNRKYQDAIFCCVRCGNLLGSRGSVLPLFISQAMNNEPLTITNPAMTRFILTPKDCVELVLHALEDAGGGEIYVRKAPSVEVGLLVEAVAKWCDVRIETKIIGTRMGEKQHEDMIESNEARCTVDDGSYYIIHPAYRPSALPSVGVATSACVTTWEYNSLVADRITDVDEIVRYVEQVPTWGIL